MQPQCRQRSKYTNLKGKPIQSYKIAAGLFNPLKFTYQPPLYEAKFKNYEIVDGNLNWNDYDLIFPIEDLYEGKL